MSGTADINEQLIEKEIGKGSFLESSTSDLIMISIENSKG